METPRAAGSIGFAWAEPFHRLTPVNPSMGAVADQLCLLVWRGFSGAFQCCCNYLHDTAECVLKKSAGDIQARRACQHVQGQAGNP